MLSNRFFQLFLLISKIGNHFGSFSLRFDPVLVKALHISDQKLETKILINRILCTLVVITCITVTIDEYIYGTINKLLLKALGTYSLFYMLLMHFITQYHIDDLVIFTNAKFGFLRYIHGEKKYKHILIIRKFNVRFYIRLKLICRTYLFTANYMPGFNRNADILNLLIDGLHLLLIVICLGFFALSTLLCLYNPRDIIFVGQLIPLKYYSYFPFGILTSLFHGYLYFIIVLSILILAGPAFGYVYYLKIFFINEFSRFPKNKYKTHESFRCSKNIIHLYRCLQILHEQMMFFGSLYDNILYPFMHITCVLQLRVILLLEEAAMDCKCTSIIRLLLLRCTLDVYFTSWKIFVG